MVHPIQNAYPKCIEGIAASELTYLPDIQILSELLRPTLSRNPYSRGSNLGGIQGYMTKIVKAKRFVRVIVRLTIANVACDGAA